MGSQEGTIGFVARYVHDAMRTRSDVYRPDLTSFATVARTLRAAGDIGDQARRCKRACFGGRADPSMTLDSIASEPVTHDPNRLPSRHVLHAVLGIVNEAGELATMIEGVMRGAHSFDRTNYVEELGDLLWFIALACDAEGLSMARVMRANLTKLCARFPDKFDATKMDDANRDKRHETSAINIAMMRNEAPINPDALEEAAFTAATEAFGKTVTAYRAVIEAETDPVRRVALEAMLAAVYDDNA